MAKVFSLISVAILAGSAGMAQAQQFNGAEIQYKFTNNAADDYSQTVINGSAEFGFGSFGVQVDATTWRYDNDSFEDSGFALHGLYDVSQNVTVGGFYGQDDFSTSTIWSFYGVEVAYGSGPYMVEAFVGTYEGSVNGKLYDNIGVNVSYYVNNNLAITGGLYGADYVSTDTTQVSVGAKYMLANGLEAQAKFTNRNFGGNNTQNVIALSLSYKIGGGTKFSQRNFAATFPGL